MRFDFETIPDRKGKDSIAADKVPVSGVEIKPGFDPISMWVADMNFGTAPAITEAIAERLKHPYFGYFSLSDEYYESIIRWQKERNGVDVPRECIGYENGALGCLVSALQVFTAPGEKVLLHSPCYIGFSGCIENNGRRLVLSELKKDENGVWRMDYEDMEKKLREEKIHFAVFCAPHNPVGRVWEKEEIERAMELYRKYDCIVVSDEIWSDIILEGHTHIPPQSVSEDAKMRTISTYALTKTFNLAGVPGAYHIIYNPYLRDRMEKQASLSHYNELSVLNEHALIGAYSAEGAAWVDELKHVLTENVNYACDFIEKNFKGVETTRPQGTYLLYLHCAGYLEAHPGMTIDDLLKKGVEYGVLWQDGRPFKHPDTIRVNLASPRAWITEAFDRLREYVFI